MKLLRPILWIALLPLAIMLGLALDELRVPAVIWLPLSIIVIFILYWLNNKVEHDESVTVYEQNALSEVGNGSDQIHIRMLADPAVIVSSTWRVVAVNDNARTLFGRRIVGMDMRQTIRHPVVVDAVRLAHQSSGPVLREVTSLGTDDGAYRVRVVPLGDGRVLIHFNDITQTRLTERMRVDFVANASHELRTPLANIGGFIETLLGPAADDEPARQRFLDIMSREAARMSRLIDDLLSLSRIELDKYVRPMTMLDLEPLVSDVGKTLAMRLETDGRVLKLELEDNLPSVVADRDQILQVLHNLVSNALKYGRSGSPITVYARTEKQKTEGSLQTWVRVGVKDEGEGIAPEHLPRLTERFYRVDTGRSRSMGGTGLGLAIVKHIVERHRGQLEIQSQQGEGTTISFALPTSLPRAAEFRGERLGSL